MSVVAGIGLEPGLADLIAVGDQLCDQLVPALGNLYERGLQRVLSRMLTENCDQLFE